MVCSAHSGLHAGRRVPPASGIDSRLRATKYNMDFEDGLGIIARRSQITNAQIVGFIISCLLANISASATLAARTEKFSCFPDPFQETESPNSTC